MKMHDQVEVTNEENLHYGKRGRVEFVDDMPHVLAPIGVSFENGGASAFRENELKVVATMEDRPYMKKERKFDPLFDARTFVQNLYYGPESENPLPFEDVYIVWFANTLKNWKALVSTNAKDDRYYEVTHNGETNETYVDEYGRKSQVLINHEPLFYKVTLIEEPPKI